MDSNVVRSLREKIDELGFNDYLKYAREVEEASPEVKPLRVAILRSYTLEQIEPVLRVLVERGLDAIDPEKGTIFERAVARADLHRWRD